MPDTTGHPALSFHDVSFAYPVAEGSGSPVLSHVSAEVPKGAFALLTGGTGSGKTTLLRLAKPEVAPVGAREGRVEVFGRPVTSLDVIDSAQMVGYVFQSPDNQIVCDTVWHELAFGLENLGLGQQEMHRRLSEVCIFLGIEGLFRRRCSELSGGQRQVVALAAVLAMRPRLLLLDEPTAMLDPVAEHEFLSLLFRANRELGITVVVATHAPASMTDYATCGLRIEGGKLCEVSLEELRRRPALAAGTANPMPGAEAVRVSDAWYRYGRTGAWVLRGCDLALGVGEVRALVGGNGCGKSTLLRIIAGVARLHRGRISNSLRSSQALLPQEPKTILRCETVREELAEWASDRKGGEVEEALARLGLADCPDRHPYDLSGGQQELLALEKILLTGPRLLLLDEPTKGLDVPTRQALATRISELSRKGCTVLLATHDMAFVRAVASSVSLLFDGRTAPPEPTEEFISNSWMWRP